MAGRCGPRTYRGSEESSAIDVNEAFKMLSNHTCRTLLYQLVTDPSNTIHIDELVETSAELLDRDRDVVELECHHTQFPALKEAGVIDYDEQSGDVRYYGDPLIEAVLDVVSQWEE